MTVIPTDNCISYILFKASKWHRLRYVILHISLRSSPSVTPNTIRSSLTRSSHSFLEDFPSVAFHSISLLPLSTRTLLPDPKQYLTLGPISLRDHVLRFSPLAPNIVSEVFLSDLPGETAADAQAPIFVVVNLVESSVGDDGTYLHDETGVGVRVVRLAHGRLRRSGADPRRA